jgi:sensor histidine kinase regulating citrate/malate metabolism
MTAAILHREAFEVSRSLDFCNKKQLTVETGHPPEEWPLVILKELLDNSLDAAEEAGVAPEINVQVSTEMLGEAGEIVITDNGPGIPPKVVEASSITRSAPPRVRPTSARLAERRATP